MPLENDQEALKASGDARLEAMHTTDGSQAREEWTGSAEDPSSAAEQEVSEMAPEKAAAVAMSEPVSAEPEGQWAQKGDEAVELPAEEPGADEQAA